MKKVIIPLLLILTAIFANADSLWVTQDYAPRGDTTNVLLRGIDTRFIIIDSGTSINNADKVFLRQNTHTLFAFHLDSVTDTSMHVSFDIPLETPTGQYDIGVIYRDSGDTIIEENCFEITTEIPRIADVFPSVADPGEELTLIITGFNSSFRIVQGSDTVNNVSSVYFQQNTSIIEADSFSTSTKTKITAHFSIPADAAIGAYTACAVQISNGDTASRSAGFEIIGASSPRIASINPTSAKQAEALTVAITGQNAVFQISDASSTINYVSRVYLKHETSVIEPTGFTILNASRVDATFTVPMDADTGLYDVAAVYRGSPIYLPQGFTIHKETVQKIISISPNFADQTETCTVAITGWNTHFRLNQGSDTTNNISSVFLKQDSALINATSFTAESSESLNAVFTIPNDAPLGLYDIQVVQISDSNTISLMDAFTVLQLRITQLISYWNFDEDTGMVCNDTSDNSNNGTIVGPTWTQGISGAALYFDGQNDYVKIPDHLTLDNTAGITIETCVKLSEVSSDHQVIIAKWYDNSTFSLETTASYVLEIIPDTKKVQLVLNLSTGRSVIQAIDDISLNEWSHIAGTYNGAIVRIYINGNLSNEEVVIGSLIAGTSPIMIGTHDHISDVNPFKGAIDELKLYDYALKPDTVRKHYEDLQATDIDEKFNTACVKKNRIVINIAGLTIYNTEKLPVDITIYNVNGRKLIHHQYTAPQNLIKVPFYSLASGVYVLKLRIGSKIHRERYVVWK